MIHHGDTEARSKLLHEQLTEQVIGAAIEVHRELGPAYSSGPRSSTPDILKIDRQASGTRPELQCFRANARRSRSKSSLIAISVPLCLRGE